VMERPLWVNRVGRATGQRLPVSPDKPTFSGRQRTSQSGRLCWKRR